MKEIKTPKEQKEPKELKEFKIKLEKAITQSDQVFIAPHLGPDFDAIASAIGFALIAQSFDKPTHIFICDDTSKIEPGVKSIIEECQTQVNFIDLNQYQKLKGKNDLLIVTDTNKINLVGCYEYLENFTDIIILDHHQTDTNTIATNTICIPQNISSTSEAMVDLLCWFDIKYKENVANYLLAGIYLDTKKFTTNVQAKQFKIVSKLMKKKGASLAKVQEWFAEEFKNAQKIQGLVSQAVIDTISYAIAFDCTDRIYTKEELAKVADQLSQFKAIDFTFAGGYISKNTISISARGNGKIDVGMIMTELGGGGNIHSAATKIEDDKTTIEEVKKHLTRILKPGFFIKQDQK